LFERVGVSDWTRAVEIGPGSGKYTLKVLEASDSVVHGFDVSPEFLSVCATPCREAVDDERLFLHLLEGKWPDEMFGVLTELGWKRTVDAVYSIDAMVHVDLQDMVVYLLTAGAVLKPGGKLILTLADMTTDYGVRKLLEDISMFFGKDVPGKFEWPSPDAVRNVLPRLGFKVVVFESEHGRSTSLRSLLTRGWRMNWWRTFCRARARRFSCHPRRRIRGETFFGAAGCCPKRCHRCDFGLTRLPWSKENPAGTGLLESGRSWTRTRDLLLIREAL
jgi:SAM-dependent methyltransferase